MQAHSTLLHQQTVQPPLKLLTRNQHASSTVRISYWKRSDNWALLEAVSLLYVRNSIPRSNCLIPEIRSKRNAQGYPSLSLNVITACRRPEDLRASSSQSFWSEPRRLFRGSSVTPCTVQTGTAQHGCQLSAKSLVLPYLFGMFLQRVPRPSSLYPHTAYSAQVNRAWQKQFMIKAEQSLHTCGHMITWYAYYKCRRL